MFVKWDRIGQSIWTDTPMNFSNLIGARIVEQGVNTSSLSGIEVSGRYYYTLQTIWNDTYDMSAQYTYGYLDNAAYIEPGPNKTISIALIVVIVIACVIVVAGIACVIYYYRKHAKEMAQRNTGSARVGHQDEGHFTFLQNAGHDPAN